MEVVSNSDTSDAGCTTVSTEILESRFAEAGSTAPNSDIAMVRTRPHKAVSGFYSAIASTEYFGASDCYPPSDDYMNDQIDRSIASNMTAESGEFETYLP